jgi:hypothetical protein
LNSNTATERREDHAISYRAAAVLGIIIATAVLYLARDILLPLATITHTNRDGMVIVEIDPEDSQRSGIPHVTIHATQLRDTNGHPVR